MELPLAIAQDIPAGGLATFPASPVTADLQVEQQVNCSSRSKQWWITFWCSRYTQLNGLAAASSSILASSFTIAQGTGDTTDGG